MNLRKTEESFALSKNFDKAKEIKKKSDLLALEEAKLARKRLISDMKMSYKTMNFRHERNKDCLFQYLNREKQNLEIRREKSSKGLVAMIKRLEDQLNKEIKPDSQQTKPILYTPRISRTFESKSIQPLVLEPINIKKIFQKKKNKKKNLED